MLSFTHRTVTLFSRASVVLKIVKAHVLGVLDARGQVQYVSVWPGEVTEFKRLRLADVNVTEELEFIMLCQSNVAVDILRR